MEMPPPGNPDVPVTMVISRVARRGRERDMERWLEKVGDVQLTFPGCRGMTVLRPREADNPEFVVILNFQNYDALKAWFASDVRNGLLKEAEELTERVQAETLTGMESWFTLPGRTAGIAPPKWKMAVVTFLAIYPLVILINLGLSPLIGDAPLPMRTLVMSSVLVPLMTWIVMPNMTRGFYGWLYPGR